MTLGRLTPAFSWAQKGTEMLRHNCILRGPQTRENKNHNLVPHPYLLGGAKDGGKATAPLLSLG